MTSTCSVKALWLIWRIQPRRDKDWEYDSLNSDIDFMSKAALRQMAMDNVGTGYEPSEVDCESNLSTPKFMQSCDWTAIQTVFIENSLNLGRYEAMFSQNSEKEI